MELPNMEQPKKERKTGAIIGSIAAIVLCGLPGLCMCLFGAITAFGVMPDFYTGYGNLPGWMGFVLLCVSIIFVIIAILVPVLTLRKKKPAELGTDIAAASPNEPLPPAS